MAFIFPFALVMSRDTRSQAAPRRWFDWFADLRVLSGVGVLGLSLGIIDTPAIEPLALQYGLLVGLPGVAGWLCGRGLTSSAGDDESDDEPAL